MVVNSSLVDSSAPGFYVTGGTLGHDAPSYVTRSADTELYDSVKRGEFCYVLTARQMGKSSLMVRTAARLREEGHAAIVLDLSAIGQNVTVEQWYKGLLRVIGEQLGLEDSLDDFWREHNSWSPLQRWTTAIRHVVLDRYTGRLVVFVDEVDAVLNLPFSTDEFFAGIRAFYNLRADSPELERLTFCLLGVASPSDLIRDPRTTPFNIGHRIELNDFTETEAEPLVQGFNRTTRTGVTLLRRVLYWTGGHPYLTQRLCHEVAVEQGVDGNEGVDRLCQALFFSHRARERDDNLVFVRERLLRSEVDLAALLGLYGQVRRRKRVRDDEASNLVNILRLSGVTRVEKGYLVVRNRIYSRVFDRQWVQQNMPDAELRRQRAAYRRGLLRAAAVSLAVVAALTVLVVIAVKQRNAAEQARAEALSRELAANAIVQLPVDPELSVLLAMEALRISQTTQAEDALRQSLPEHHAQAVMRKHEAPVRCVAFSPDSRLVVTASHDKTARVWEAQTGRNVAELIGHTHRIDTASFSPDGKLVVTASYDGTARVWEANTAHCRIQFRGHSERVTSAQFSPDGKVVVTTSTDKTTRVWKPETGEEVAVLRGNGGFVWAAKFSLDGQLLFTANRDVGSQVWATHTWRRVADGRGFATSFSLDGKRVVAGTPDGALIWESRTGRVLTKLGSPTIDVQRPVFSPDGQLVASGGYDGIARIWDARSGRVLKELRGHTSKVWNAAFSPDGKLVVTASNDGTGRIWEVSTGRSLKELRGHGSGMDCEAVFSPNGNWVVTGSEDGTARVWTVNRGMATELRGHMSQLSRVAFSPDGKLIATAGRDGMTHIWQMATGQSLRALRGHSRDVRSIAFSPDGELAVSTSGWENTARIWRLSTAECLSVLNLAPGVWDAVFSRDGRFLATGGHDGIARIWEVSTGRIVAELRGHSAAGREGWSAGVTRLAFSPDGKLLVTGSHDTTARVWETGTWHTTRVLRGHTGILTGVAFSPDGKWVATSSFDTTTRIWEVQTGRSLRELRGPKGFVTSVAFSHDGAFLLAGSTDGMAHVWDASSGQRVTQIRGHSDGVTSAGFSPDGRFVVTSSEDKTARISPCEVCRPIPELLALARSRVTRSLTPEEREKYLHETPQSSR